MVAFKVTCLRRAFVCYFRPNGLNPYLWKNMWFTKMLTNSKITINTRKRTQRKIWMKLVMVVHLVSVLTIVDGEITAMSWLVVRKLGRFIDQTSKIQQQVHRGSLRRNKLLGRVPQEKGKKDTEKGRY